VAKKKQADDLYDLIAGALPESNEESVKVETKEDNTSKYNTLSYSYGVVPSATRKKYYDIVEISFDLSTDYSRIIGIVGGADSLQVAIVKAEQKQRANLILKRRG